MQPPHPDYRISFKGGVGEGEQYGHSAGQCSRNGCTALTWFNINAIDIWPPSFDTDCQYLAIHINAEIGA
jgi:hypothetical protein